MVKGVRFLDHRDAGDPVDMAIRYDREGADELVFYDITASAEERGIMREVVARVAEQVFIPLSVGGGLRSVEDMQAMLKTGAEKVSINTAAVENPELIREGADRFGSQCIVVALDVKRIAECEHAEAAGRAGGSEIGVDGDSTWEVYTRGGRTPTGIDALKWAGRAAELGAGELLVTSMDTDGQLTGYDLEVTRAISDSVGVPVIASGGAGNLEHLYDALETGRADAVLAASIFHYGDYTIRQAKRYLSERGLPIRPRERPAP